MYRLEDICRNNNSNNSNNHLPLPRVRSPAQQLATPSLAPLPLRPCLSMSSPPAIALRSPPAIPALASPPLWHPTQPLGGILKIVCVVSLDLVNVG